MGNGAVNVVTIFLDLPKGAGKSVKSKRVVSKMRNRLDKEGMRFGFFHEKIGLANEQYRQNAFCHCVGEPFTMKLAHVALVRGGRRHGRNENSHFDLKNIRMARIRLTDPW
jgi:hypothetical protein